MFSCFFLFSSAESIKPRDNEQNSTLLFRILSKICLWEATLCCTAVPLWAPAPQAQHWKTKSPENKPPLLGWAPSPWKKLVRERLMNPFLLTNWAHQMQQRPSSIQMQSTGDTPLPRITSTLTPALIYMKKFKKREQSDGYGSAKDECASQAPLARGQPSHSHPASSHRQHLNKTKGVLRASLWKPVDISTASALEVLTPYPIPLPVRKLGS